MDLPTERLVQDEFGSLGRRNGVQRLPPPTILSRLSIS